jgi:hypothetical protein
MNRFDILLKKTPPPPPVIPPEELPKYYMGMDVSYRIRDNNTIVISHKFGNKIIIDHAEHVGAFHMAPIFDWAKKLSREFPIQEGIVDDIHMARDLGFKYDPSISSEMIFILNSNQSNIVYEPTFRRRPYQPFYEVLSQSNMRDALIRSVWLTVKNSSDVTPVTDKIPSFEYSFR